MISFASNVKFGPKACIVTAMRFRNQAHHPQNQPDCHGTVPFGSDGLESLSYLSYASKIQRL